MKRITKSPNPFFGWRGPNTQHPWQYHFEGGAHVFYPDSHLTRAYLESLGFDVEQLPKHDGVARSCSAGRWRSYKFWLPETILLFQEKRAA